MKLILFTILFLLSITNLFSEEGYYEYSYVGTHNLSAVKTPNGTVTGGKLDGIVTVLKSSGNLFLVGQNTNSVCIILSKKSKENKNSELEAYCEATDLDTGDKTFAFNIRKEGNVNSGSKGQGKQTIIGGTGKYKGIKGECNYTVKYLPDNKLSTLGSCNYKI